MTSNPFFFLFLFILRLESLSGNFARKRDDKKKVEEEDGIKNKTSKATTKRRDCVFIEEERENKISASCALFSKKTKSKRA
jgi:hypothetical protein